MKVITTLVPLDNNRAIVINIRQDVIDVQGAFDSSFKGAFIQWDNLNDVEMLSDMFGDLRVKDFRKLIEELGKVYQYRGQFMEMLK